MRYRGLIFSTLFAALFAVLSLVEIPIGTVPISLETLIVMIAGGLLGPWYGGLTFLIVIGLDLAGLPLIAGHAGPSFLVSATAGYIWGWPFCAFFAGLAVRRVRVGARGEWIWLLLILFFLGDFLCYFSGVLWLRHVVAAVRPWGSALAAGFWPYLPGDAAKAVIAAIIVARVRRIYPMDSITRGEQFVQGD
ncbi:biotin transporter BioY [Alicyclobacillus acidiphilus]|uniref:biotin transporter BioY n=1 Tax=Alicyclobacillus acidiphilus TaxID=182455 RepID=UPI00082A3381|nr:biotin transporter BioY [Alicyclobacillus acidiphilus]